MDGAPTAKAASGGKAVLPAVPAGIDAGAAATTSARGARKATWTGAGAGKAADAPAAATPAAPGAESNGGAGGEEEDDSEQVERFYALLDNIRAMRGAYVSGSGNGDGGTGADGDVVDTAGGGGAARVKRLRRGSEQSWRPAFRLEDFEQAAPTSPSSPSSSSDVTPCGKRTRWQEADGDGSAASADVAVARVRLDSGRKSV